MKKGGPDDPRPSGSYLSTQRSDHTPLNLTASAAVASAGVKHIPTDSERRQKSPAPVQPSNDAAGRPNAHERFSNQLALAGA